MHVAAQDISLPPDTVDRIQLQLKDDDFEPHTWEDLRRIIAENRLEVLRRFPSDLKRYVAWSNDIKAEYGNVPNYIMQMRLRWTLSPETTPQTGPLFEYRNPIPFADPKDYKTLPNDWPYGLDHGITHLIVWLKTRLETEPTKGDMTPRARTQVQDFVQRTFIEPTDALPGQRDKIMWFKNWAALQSVPGMDHVHILVRDVPEDIILEWTDGEKQVQ